MDVDVAIIGGGPAGCAAAIALRALRQSVTVIASPNEREKPTETAVPALSRLLHALGTAEALSACEPCYGIVSSWGRTAPALKPSITNPFGHAWFIHRTRFDPYLQRTARAAGATWIPEQARSVDFDLRGVSVHTTGMSVRARWAILATGSPSWPARVTHQSSRQMDSLVACWARIPATLRERLLFVEPTARGWWYLCPADGTGAIACFVTDPLSARKLCAAQAAAWNMLFQRTLLSRQLQCAPVTERLHVALIGLAALPQTHGLRWIAVGDAAAKLDPLGSSGTATALDSGQRAAHAVADALQGNSSSSKRYELWRIGLFEEFTRQRRQQYEIEARRRADGFWPRRLARAQVL